MTVSPDAGIAHRLYACNDVSDFSGLEDLACCLWIQKIPASSTRVRGAVGPETDGIARSKLAVKNPQVYDGAAVRVPVRVENERFQRRCWIAFWRRGAVYNCFEDFFYANAFFGGHRNRGFGIQTQVLLDLRLDPVHIGRRQVYLIDNGYDLQILFHGHVEIGERLCLDALRRVNNEQSAFA